MLASLTLFLRTISPLIPLKELPNFVFFLNKICLIRYKRHKTVKNPHYNKEKDGEAKLNKIRAGTEVQIMV